MPQPSSNPSVPKPAPQTIQKPVQPLSQPNVAKPAAVAKPAQPQPADDSSDEEYDDDDDDEFEEEEEEEEGYGDFEVDPGDFPFKDEQLQGIFYHIAQEVGSPVRNGLVSMDGGGGRLRSLKYLIDMNDNDRWWCNKDGKETRWEDAWFTLKFLRHTVKLTNYTLYCNIGSPFCAQPKSWKLYGKNRNTDWILLDEQKNVKGMNNKSAKMTFPIPRKNQAKYTDYKMVCTENFTKHEDGKFFLSKLEFFGSLLYQ